MKAGELQRLVETVRSAGREAAAVAHAGFRKHPVVEHKGAVDLVTSFDRDSEALLRERLGGLGFDIIGEEAGGTWTKTQPAFFIDPIDGTTNFVHGHPFWCVSIGLVVETQPILGVVIAPSLALEWCSYLADGGERTATRNDMPCSVSGMKRFEDSLLATGFPYDRRSSAENNFDAFVAIKQRCQAVRRCGSAALDLCLVADGTYEGYWERKLRAWDVAAGIAMVRAAGGTVTEPEGGDACVASGNVVATNGHIHDALLAELEIVASRR